MTENEKDLLSKIQKLDDIIFQLLKTIEGLTISLEITNKITSKYFSPPFVVKAKDINNIDNRY